MTSEGLLFTSLCGTDAADFPRRFSFCARHSTSPTLVGKVTASENDPIYGAVLLVLQDENGDAWYMENSGSVLAKSGTTAATLSNLALKVGGCVLRSAIRRLPTISPIGGSGTNDITVSDTSKFFISTVKNFKTLEGDNTENISFDS